MWTLIQSQTNTRTRRPDSPGAPQRSVWVEPGSPRQRGSIRFKTIAKIAIMGNTRDSRTRESSHTDGEERDRGLWGEPAKVIPAAKSGRMSVGMHLLSVGAAGAGESLSDGPMSPKSPGATRPDGRPGQGHSPSARSTSSAPDAALMRDWGLYQRGGRQSVVSVRTTSRSDSLARESVTSSTVDGSVSHAGSTHRQDQAYAASTSQQGGMVGGRNSSLSSQPAGTAGRGSVSLPIEDGPPLEEEEWQNDVSEANEDVRAGAVLVSIAEAPTGGGRSSRQANGRPDEDISH